MLRRIWSTASWLLPILSVGVFVLLYVVAAAKYPGGTRWDPSPSGFSFAGNYWCDLMDAKSYGGSPNPARPAAQAALVILCGGLAVLWVAAPALFPHPRWRAWVVRLGGIGCALAAPWVGTSLHDVAVRAAALFGVTALVLTIAALPELAATSACVLALVVFNYVVWEIGFGRPFLPLAQKLAFAAALTWIVLLALRVRGARRT